MSLFPVLGDDDETELAAPLPVSPWARARRRSYEILERAQSRDRVSKLVDITLILLITSSVVAIILESIDSLFSAYARWFFWFEVMTVAVFTVEYILRSWCSVECSNSRARHGNALSIRIRHMLSPSAIVDLVAVLPFYLMVGGLITPTDMRFLRVIRLLRVLKLTRYSAAFDMLAQACKENTPSFAAAFFVLIVVMLLAATGMYYFEHTTQPEAFASIPSSMWWAFSTLTTVGYGDVTPVTNGGKVFGALITVVGIGMVALPTGILASAYTEQLRIRSDQYRQQSDIAYEDGILSADEARELEQLRQSLGLSKNTASHILSTEQFRASLRTNRVTHTCPHCGAKENPRLEEALDDTP